MRLPTDMANMNVTVKRLKLLDQFGSSEQLFGNFARKYKGMVKYYAIWSIILSYSAALLKGLLNALWWLARGPFDALTVARDARLRQPGQWWHIDSVMWWVSPLIHGASEGLYRALAELIGNTIFGIVLILNAIRHLVLGVTRKRAHGILDGFMYGVQGLFLDTFVTPFSQLYFQTMKCDFNNWDSTKEDSMVDSGATWHDTFAASHDWRVRYEILVQLRMKGPDAVAEQVDALTGFARSRFPFMRKLALEAFAVLPPEKLAKHVDVILEKLVDTDDDVCYEAVQTLRLLDPMVLGEHSNSSKMLANLLMDEVSTTRSSTFTPEDWNLRKAALEALGRLDPLRLTPHVEAIEACCSDEVSQVRLRAKEVLDKLEKELPRLVVTCNLNTESPKAVRDDMLITCISMAGNTLAEVSLASSGSVEELRAKVAEELKVPPMQLKLLTSSSDTSEPSGNSPLNSLFSEQRFPLTVS